MAVEPSNHAHLRSVIRDLGLAASLLIRPGRLANVAAQISIGTALLASVVAMPILAGCICFLPHIGIAEPWASVGRYAKAAIGWTLAGGLFCGAPFVIACLLVAIFATEAMQQDRPAWSRRAAAARLALLAPICLLIPVLAWGFFVACDEAVGNIFQGHPKWFESPLVKALSWRGMSAILGAYLLAVVVHGAIKLRRMPLMASTVTCRACGYDLRGLRNARCPECGSRFESPPVENRRN